MPVTNKNRKRIVRRLREEAKKLKKKDTVSKKIARATVPKAPKKIKPKNVVVQGNWEAIKAAKREKKRRLDQAGKK